MQGDAAPVCAGLDLHALHAQLSSREADMGEGASVSSAADSASLDDGPYWRQQARIICRMVLDYSMLSWFLVPCIPCLPEIDDANIGRTPSSAQSAQSV